jgi:hypothetical protein
MRSECFAQDDKKTLTFYIFRKHFFRVDGYEDAAAAGQDFAFVVQDFGAVDVSAALDFYFASFNSEGFVQRDWLEIFDGHLPRERDHVVEFVYLAHGVVEDAGDHSAVGVARGASVALAEAKFANEGLAGFVQDEFQAHAFRVVLSADEAVVFLHLYVAGVVALGARGHGGILIYALALCAAGWRCWRATSNFFYWSTGRLM